MATLAGVAMAWLIAGPAQAQAAQQVIASSGPMTSIYLNDDLACQVMMANDANPVFYGGTNPGACGTYLQMNQPAGGGLLFGATVPAGLGPTDYTPFSQTPVTGSGTTGSPFTVTTVVNAESTPGTPPSLATLTETDTYVVGSSQYDTTLTLTNTSGAALTGTLYHAGDCYFGGVNGGNPDVGYGGLGTGNAPQCTITPNDNPPGRIMSFIPVTGPTSSYYEGYYGTNWGNITSSGGPLPDTIDATTLEDNAMSLGWPYSLTASGAGATTTISFVTFVNPNSPPVNTAPPTLSGSPVVGQTLTCLTGAWSSTVPITYTYQWFQDGGSTPLTGATSSTYTVAATDVGHTLDCQVTANSSNGATTASTADEPALTGPAAPAVPPTSQSPPSVTGQTAGFSAQVNPNGAATTVHFEYGLDPKYGLTTAANLYTNTTADQQAGAGSILVPLTAIVTGLVPNALYHVRVVATNSKGTTFGPDQTFMTAPLAPPPAPVIGKEANFTPISGMVYVRLPGTTHAGFEANFTSHAIAALTKGVGFVPLTQARQLPVGTQVDARAGSLQLVTATSTKKGGRTTTQSGDFSQGLFQVVQSTNRKLKGLTTLSLLDNGIFKGAPSYKTECASVGKTTNNNSLVFRHRGLSKKALNSLVSNEHGNYQTKGKYSAATVRGTVFTVTDRCDGTLTSVRRGSVSVTVYRQPRKRIVLHSHQSFLAKAP